MDPRDVLQTIRCKECGIIGSSKVVYIMDGYTVNCFIARCPSIADFPPYTTMQQAIDAWVAKNKP